MSQNWDEDADDFEGPPRRLMTSPDMTPKALPPTRYEEDVIPLRDPFRPQRTDPGVTRSVLGPPESDPIRTQVPYEDLEETGGIPPARMIPKRGRQRRKGVTDAYHREMQKQMTESGRTWTAVGELNRRGRAIRKRLAAKKKGDKNAK